MKECIIKTSSSRDYYTVGKLDYYWDSISKHLGDTVELIKSESTGKKYKRLCYTVEVKDVEQFEELIKQSVFDNWIFDRDYSVKELNKLNKKRKVQDKVEKLKKQLVEAEKMLKLF